MVTVSPYQTGPGLSAPLTITWCRFNVLKRDKSETVTNYTLEITRYLMYLSQRFEVVRSLNLPCRTTPKEEGLTINTKN